MTQRKRIPLWIYYVLEENRLVVKMCCGKGVEDLDYLGYWTIICYHLPLCFAFKLQTVYFQVSVLSLCRYSIFLEN